MHYYIIKLKINNNNSNKQMSKNQILINKIKKIKSNIKIFSFKIIYLLNNNNKLCLDRVKLKIFKLRSLKIYQNK